MAKNKAFVCFCVDGPSEKDALESQFSELFDEVGGIDINLEFRYAEFQGENHGDITTLSGVHPDNIERSIYKYYFKNKDKNSGLGWEDLTSIVHIIDLDGAYVDDEISEFSPEELMLADRLITKGKPKNTLYYDDHIAVRPVVNASAVSRMADRNKRKRQNIEHLLSIDSITIGKKTVKYSLYYFSSNLDHFLYGDANLNGAKKMQYASDFSDEIDDADSLISFFKENEFCTTYNFENSWNKLRKGTASLMRGTNVNLLVEKIKNSAIEDWA